MTDNTISLAIADQIGRTAFMMMGTKNRIYDTRELMFDIRGSKRYNKIVVTLDPSDTYTIRFLKLSRMGDIKADKSVSDVYNDSLHRVIEHHTGLCLSL